MKKILLLLWCAALLGMIAFLGIRKQEMELPPTEPSTEETIRTEPTAPPVDYREAGTLAAEAMLEALKSKKVKEGAIGILSTDITDAEALQREAGFRAAFEDTGFILLETRYDGGNPSMARSIAWQILSQGAAGLYSCSPEGTQGAGEAEKQADSSAFVAGFGQSEEILALLQEGAVQMTVAAEMGPGAGNRLVQLVSDIPFLKTSDFRISLIAADRVTPKAKALANGAMAAAAELGCEVDNRSPLLPDEEKTVLGIQAAVASDSFAIIAALEESEAILSALQKAKDAGIQVLWVSREGQGQGGAVLSADERAAGKQAAERMMQELEAREIQEGSIGIIQVGEDDPAGVLRETGFREAFEGTAYTLLETRYSGGDAARSHAIAEDYLKKKAVGLFCCSEGCSIGAGNAVKEKKSKAVVVGIGVSDTISKLLEEGSLTASSGVDDAALGYESVKTVCGILLGAEPETLSPTPGLIVTATADAQS